MTAEVTTERTIGPQTRQSAIVWIDSTKAIVARTLPDGGSSATTILHPVNDAAEDSHDLAAVADGIGNCDQILILGPVSMRTALEREYVAIFQRPDRIVDIDTAVDPTEAELLERLHRLVQ